MKMSIMSSMVAVLMSVQTMVPVAGVVIVPSAVAMAAVATPATADTVSVSCRNVSRDACDTIIEMLERAPYIGPIRQSTVPMACARVVSYKESPVVWIDGNDRNYRSASVIDATGVVYTETFSLNDEWVVTESCIRRSLLDSVRNLTLCTGQGADGYHWALTSVELRQMKQTGHFTSYVPFLEVRDRDSLSVSRVTAAYSARYGAHYVK